MDDINKIIEEEFNKIKEAVEEACADYRLPLLTSEIKVYDDRLAEYAKAREQLDAFEEKVEANADDLRYTYEKEIDELRFTINVCVGVVSSNRKIKIREERITDDEIYETADVEDKIAIEFNKIKEDVEYVCDDMRLPLQTSGIEVYDDRLEEYAELNKRLKEFKEKVKANDDNLRYTYEEEIEKLQFTINVCVDVVSRHRKEKIREAESVVIGTEGAKAEAANAAEEKKEQEYLNSLTPEQVGKIAEGKNHEQE